MKAIKSFFFLLLLVSNSCAAQKENTNARIAMNDSLFTIVNSSLRDIYPGMDDGNNRYRQQWIVMLEGPGQVKCNLFLLLKGYKIPIGELGTMGIVIGSDTDSYEIAFDVNYPLELNYSKSEIDVFSDAVLLIKKDEDQILLKIEELTILEPIIYPSAAH